MKQVSGKALARAIEQGGWRLARVRGSDHIFLKEGRQERIVIPMHGNQPLKIGLLRAQMKIAGLHERDLRGATTTVPSDSFALKRNAHA